MQISPVFNFYTYTNSYASFQSPSRNLEQDTSAQSVANSSDTSLENESTSATKQGLDETQKQENSQESDPTELSQSEQALVRELQMTDTKVRAHEMAHQAAGGGLAGAASYTYERGPDNKMYAVAGEVPISMQAGNTPEETIANARQIQAAAMAPADPSPQDFKVAASAMRMEIEARAEQARIEQEERKAQELENEEQRAEQEGVENASNSGFDEALQESQNKESEFANKNNLNIEAINAYSSLQAQTLSLGFDRIA